MTNIEKTKNPFRYAITGTHHGSIVYAKTEGDARRAFHQRYNGELIISVNPRRTAILLEFFDSESSLLDETEPTNTSQQ
jgi:hypothetical protein